MDQDLDVWNRLFHDGVVLTMKGQVPGDIEVIIEPGIGNRSYFPDAGKNFVVILRGCSACELTRHEDPAAEPVHDLAAVWGEPSLVEVRRDGDYLVFDCLLGDLRFKVAGSELLLDSGRPVSYDELAHSCDMWWQAWKERNQL